MEGTVGHFSGLGYTFANFFSDAYLGFFFAFCGRGKK